MSVFMELSELREVHLELTSKCNALCPQCARSVLGATVDPNLPMLDLTMDDIEKIFTKEICQQLELVLLCGTHGDPIFSNIALETVEHLKSNGVKSVWLYTNGSGKSEDWWKNLAQLMKDPKDRVCFSIDGLEDTNHLYRIGTNWNTIMRSVKAYIGAGGRARWECLVFRHNEHQIEEVQDLAKEMGFHDFRTRKTARFLPQFLGHALPMTPVLKKMNREQALEFVENFEFIPNEDFDTDYIIWPPLDKKNRNHANAEKIINVKKQYGTFEAFVDQAPISCIYKEQFNRVYINSNAKLWPCSYLGALEFEWRKSVFYRDLKEKVTDVYGPDFNCLRKHSLEEALHHPWLGHDLIKSFSCGLDDEKTPRLKKCGRTCGAGFDPIASQTEHRRFIKTDN